MLITYYPMNITVCELKHRGRVKAQNMRRGSEFKPAPGDININTSAQIGIVMRKINQAIFFILLVSGAISGCNTIPTSTVATACEQGIEKLSSHLNAESFKVSQVNLSRANSLLLSAQIQLQFAEYPGCVEKVKRAQDYLSGNQTAIISRLSI